MLKKSLFLCIFMFLAANLQAQQQNAQYLFDEANQLLQEGKIVQALNRYQAIVEKKKTSGALFINMGYVYMKLGKLGKAKYYFLKAKQFEETRKKALAGLSYVNDQLSHQTIVLPALPWEKALNWLMVVLGPTLILAIGIILVNIGIFVLIGSWFKKNTSSAIPKAATILAFVGVLVALLSFYIDYRRERYSRAVMVKQMATVMKKPTEKSAPLNKAYEGYSFKVDHQKTKGHKKWVFIIMKTGVGGGFKGKKL